MEFIIERMKIGTSKSIEWKKQMNHKRRKLTEDNGSKEEKGIKIAFRNEFKMKTPWPEMKLPSEEGKKKAWKSSKRKQIETISQLDHSL